MIVRSDRAAVMLAFAAIILAGSTARADAPVNLAATRPTPAVAQGTCVLMPLATIPSAGAISKVSPRRSVSYIFYGPSIAVCTTFPGTVSLDGAGNVYKQPVETDAQGHQRAVGVPASLTATKQYVGVITTVKP